jgi:hypothetical protein
MQARQVWVEMFGKLFGKKKQAPTIIVARLNARVQPIQRGDIFEDPLDAALKERGIGAVVGGGTEMAPPPAGIASCDVEIQLNSLANDLVNETISLLEGLGAPKGSQLVLPDGATRPFGKLEGLALFLNGTDLPDEVYASSDVNRTVEGLNKSMVGEGFFMGHWQGPSETALYFYGRSFAGMRAASEEYTKTDALCAQCRIEQIA